MKDYRLATKEEAKTPKADTIMKESSFLECADNRIYFYSEIERDKTLQLNRTLRNVSKELLVNQKTLGLLSPANIFLHIQSYGGSIFAGLSAMDEIIRCPVPVITVVDGCAASAATFLTVVGKHRQISRNAYMLIHQLSSMSWGTFWQLQDDNKNNEALMKKIKEIYARYTKVPAKQLKEVLSHDLWWDAETCLKYGLVDEVI